MRNNNIDKAIKEKLEGFSVPPPPSVWAGVQGQLAAQRRKKWLVLFGWISAAAVVILAMLAGWHFNANNTPNNKLAEGQTIKQQTVQPKNISDILNTKETKTPKQLITPNNNKTITELKKDEVQNSNKMVTELKKEKTQNGDVILVATRDSVKNANNENAIAPDEKSEQMGKTKVRLQMKKLEHKIFQLKNRTLEIALVESSTQSNETMLTNTDKLLMASNIASTNKNGDKNNGWKMGLNITPGYSSQVANHSTSYTQELLYASENGNTNIGGGFAIQYKTSKKVSIESGVYYAQNRQKSSYSNKTFALNSNAVPPDNLLYNNITDGVSMSTFSNTVRLNNGALMMNGNAGVVAFSGTPKGAEIATTVETKNLGVQNTIVTNGKFLQVFDFIEIPLLVRYRVLDKKIGIELVGGVNTGIIIGNNAYFDNSYGVQNIGSTQDISSVNLSGAVGIGMNYALGKHISVAIEPRLNYYFSSINSNPEVDYRPYRVGISTGVYYAF